MELGLGEAPGWFGGAFQRRSHCLPGAAQHLPEVPSANRSGGLAL